MRRPLQIVGFLFLLFAQACGASGSPSPPAATGTALPSPVPFTLTPLPTRTATLPPPTQTSHPPTPIPSATPTALPALYSPAGYPILPSNGPDEWLLYDSPQSITVLLFDGTSMWAGSRSGGLTQWDPVTLTAVRHTHATGFPLRTVNDLAYDAPSGYLYAVGDAGLAVWDGANWRGFSAEQLGFAQDDPLTAVAVETGTTTVWVGADELWNPNAYWEGPTWIEGGLARGDWQANTWEQFRTPDPLRNNQINDLAFDPQGNLWIASGQYANEPTNGGVSCHHTDGTWTHWGWTFGSERYLFDRGLDGYAFGALAISPQGGVYVGGRRGVRWLDTGTDIWQSVDVDDTHQLFLDTTLGMLWIAAQEGIFQLDTSGLQSLPHVDDAWQAVTLDGEGNVWFGGWQGLFRIQDSKIESMPVPNALQGLEVYDVAVDGNDTIWLRSEGGINQVVGDRIFHFSSESLAIEAAYPWTGRDSLWPVAPDSTLWLLEDESLRGYNTSGWQIVPLDIPSDTYVYSYTAGAYGTLVVAVHDGLRIYTPEQGWRIAPYPQVTYDIRGLIYNVLTNTIWTTLDMGEYYTDRIARYELGTDEWIIYTEDTGGISYVPPYGMTISPTGEIWAVNSDEDWNFDSMVSVYTGEGVWQTIIPPVAFLGDSGFRGIFMGNSGELWLTTSEPCRFEDICTTGLFYYSNSYWYWFTAEHSGLSSDGIYDISFDSAGNAWLATDNGLQMVPRP